MDLIHQSTGHSDLQVQGKVQERGLLRDVPSGPSYGEYRETLQHRLNGQLPHGP
jgi:hypothetical protein